MNIGFDLDKIFINNPPLVPSWLITKLYGEKVNGHLTYRIPGPIEQRIRKMSHVPLLRQPIRKNIATVESNIHEKNIHVFLISSRYGFLQNETEKVIQKNHLDKIFTQMLFNGTNQQPHLFKDAMLSEKQIDRYVDDDLPLLSFLAPRHPKILFFWFNKTKSEKLEKNVYAITNLADVFKKL